MLWPSESSFYEQAQRHVERQDDGWTVRSKPPGHLFVAWEMAVRYEAACLEAAFHYGQICAGNPEDDFTRRVERIEALASTAQRLSESEQRLRSLLPDDPRTLRFMADSPHPNSAPLSDDSNPRLRELGASWLSNVCPQLEEAIGRQKNGMSFNLEVLPTLLEADAVIPGPGMQSAVWNEGRYWYPFNEEFELILRPLRYITAYLNQACYQSVFTRAVIETAGGHLEGCLKDLCRTKGKLRSYPQKPLGALIKKRVVKQGLPDEIINGIGQLTHLAVNPAKHEYTNKGNTGSVFSFGDAVYAYFLARWFGAAVLDASKRIGDVSEAVENAAARRDFFRGTPLTVN